MNKTKKALIISATKEIKAHGYEKASVARIASGAKVAKGTFYVYFSQKSEIVPAIAETLMEGFLNDLIKKTPETANLGVFLSYLIDQVFDYTQKEKDLILMTYSGMALYNIFDRWEAVYAPFYDYVKAQLLRLSPLKGMSHGALANLVVGTIEHAAENYVFSQKALKPLSEAKNDVYAFLLLATGGALNAS